jgi:ribosomal protein L11 methyltransferase
MREIAIRVPAAGVEPVLDELLPLAPHGVWDVDRGDEVELRVRGHRAEMPSLECVLDAAGSWLRWSGEREVPDDWREQRRLDAEPLVVAGRLSLRAPWAPPPPDDSALVDVVLDNPHAAFGSGTHPTTRGCLEALLELPPSGSFADLGCGSGVLAIAAHKLGFAPVTALDFDPDAVAAARANAACNGVVLNVRRGDLTNHAPPAADVMAANVMADLHMSLAKRLARRAPRVLIAAGIRAEEAEPVAAAYADSARLEPRRVRGTAEWPVLELARPRGVPGAG